MDRDALLIYMCEKSRSTSDFAPNVNNCLSLKEILEILISMKRLIRKLDPKS